MFTSLYKIKIEGKDVKRFLKTLISFGIRFENVSIDNKVLYVTVNKDNLKKLKEVKTSYDINIVQTFGVSLIKKILKDNYFMFISILIGLFLLVFLSNLTFGVEIMHDDKEIRTILENELEKYGIKKYSFLKNYDEIKEIKDKIKEENKDKIEWLEIEKNGCVYTIKVDKRIINSSNKDEQIRHIVAKKAGIIMDINAEKGEIVTKINDYVKKGDILISGEIHRNDEVKGTVRAEGSIYAEVWYKVKVETPINYKEEVLTGKNKYVLNIEFLGNNFNLFNFDNYENKFIQKNILINDAFGLFKVSINKESEVIVKDEIYDMASMEFNIEKARERLKENLKEDEYIISQKKLKTIINNSTMVTEVFFKVYENITAYQDITLENEQKEGE